MKYPGKRYHAKLMIAGEYGVVVGGEALSVPLELFGAEMKKADQSDTHETVLASRNGLHKLWSYLDQLPSDSFQATYDGKAFKKDFEEGWFLDSNVPQGYGIGSSGVVTAAIYDNYFTGDSLSLAAQRKDLALIESCFHGKSSGVDALSCYTGQPLLFRENRIIPLERNPLYSTADYRFFLIDSGQVFDTGPLVNTFLEKMKNESFSKEIHHDYLPLVSRFIDSLVNPTNADPGLLFSALSDFHWKNFRPMIPENMEDVWLEGQVSSLYYLKINGSGGGFLVGLTTEDSLVLVEEMLSAHPITWLQKA